MEKNGFCDEGCGTELTFWVVFLYSFSGESAAEYAANSGLFNFFRENLLKKTKSKFEKMIENLDGTNITKCF